MLVPESLYEEVEHIARAHVETIRVGDPLDPESTLGPVISETQFEKIQELIGAGIIEGATLVCGGVDRPEHLSRGYFVKPTIFGRDLRTSA